MTTARQHWVQIAVTTQHEALAEAVFEQFDASAITLLEAADALTVELEPHEQPAFDLTKVVGLFTPDIDTEAVGQALQTALGQSITIETRTLEQEDWETAWTQYHPPLYFGQRLWVAPHDAEVSAQPDDVILRLDPGLAFGTGTHPTTALCLEWLASHDVRGLTVLDYGCGSGILAIAALLLGAKKVVAVDIDAQAIRATQENALANHVADHLETPHLDELGDAQYDLVLANILARPLLGLAPTLANHTQIQGQLLLSGLLTRHVDGIQTAYQPWFNFAPSTVQDDWVRLDATRLR